LRNIRQVKGLRRVTTLSDQQLDELILAQKDVLGGKMHIRLMTKHLRSFCRVWVTRERVQKSLQIVDPEGRHTWAANNRNGHGVNAGQSNTANNEEMRAGSPLSEAESVDSVDSYGGDDMPMNDGDTTEINASPVDTQNVQQEVEQQQPVRTNTPLVETQDIQQQNLLPLVDVTRILPEASHLMPTEFNYHEEEILRLSHENRSLRTQNSSLVSENNYLRAEIARLTATQPFLPIPLHSNWISNGRTGNVI
jgi:hypothetical protein